MQFGVQVRHSHKLDELRRLHFIFSQPPHVMHLDVLLFFRLDARRLVVPEIEKERNHASAAVARSPCVDAIAQLTAFNKTRQTRSEQELHHVRAVFKQA